MKKLLFLAALQVALSAPAVAQSEDAPPRSNDGTGYIGASVLLSSE